MTDPLLYDETTLLVLVAKGDETAFRQLFKHWQPFLSTHIFRITESRELTEEIVQDVFLKIWMSRESLSEIENFKAYLIVVSRNHAINALRKVAKESRQWKYWVREYTETEKAADPSIIYYSMIDEAIDRLPSRQKEVYLLHRHERLTYHQIAEQLGISKETVKTHLELAVAAISKCVKQRVILVLLSFFFIR
ncbi:sigma-70 family RNA polymerase sigma factor [Chitinophagaceae bacterium LB-8]|uniref:RNA polymerase sigma factor n=1 Tax=Paraflavisolibacter caeni TaxID=2982496 RepID=A0A9X2XYU7_9BACT|nr:sigma-70 family RNA polymerase sigma factor [Paraflavisolibacter caeni]MCU7550113.1 sigma-70 family RNA polymerase sigma factor [Paraflavisolibacter caeni]